MEKSKQRKTLASTFLTGIVMLFLTSTSVIAPKRGPLAPPTDFYESYEQNCISPSSGPCYQHNTDVTFRNNKVTSDYRAAVAALTFDSIGLGISALTMYDRLKNKTIPEINRVAKKLEPHVKSIQDTLEGKASLSSTLNSLGNEITVLTEFTPFIQELKDLMKLLPGVTTPLTGFTYNVGNTFGLNLHSPKHEWGVRLATSSIIVRDLIKLINERVMPLLSRANEQLIRVTPELQKSFIKISQFAKQFSTFSSPIKK